MLKSVAVASTIITSGLATGPARRCLLESTSTPQFQAADLVQENVELNEAAPLGQYSVKVDEIKNVPGLTQGAPNNAYIYYPTSALEEGHNGNFPFLSFAHGLGVGGGLEPGVSVAYKTLLETVAAQGFIVMAATTCPRTLCVMDYKDQLATISAAKNHPELHPALKNADLTNVGVFGHSMGGMATINSAQASGYNIKAAVALHNCLQLGLTGSGIKVPILFTAGSVDSICQDGCAYSIYNQVPAGQHKVFFDISGTTHMEPTNIGGNREDQAVALWFQCYLKGEQCDKVKGAEICKQVTGGKSMYSCLTAGGETSNSTVIV